MSDSPFEDFLGQVGKDNKMTNQFHFQKAEKAVRKARIALIGPSGSGKTKTALEIAAGLVEAAGGGRVALIDTENMSASLYADQYEFDTLALATFAPRTYVQAIKAAQDAGYDVLIIDSLSHAWIGKDGALAMVDQAKGRYQGNSFAAWKDVTPEHNALVDALVWCKMHLIVTMRSKTEYAIQEDERGKKTPVKLGMAPVQRDGLEYEMDIVADLDMAHNLIPSKSRYQGLLDGVVLKMPDRKIGHEIAAWLSTATAAPLEPVTKVELAKAPPGKESGSNGSRLGGDASTQYWAKVREHGIDRDLGTSILDEFEGDFEKAKAHIQAEYEEKGV